MGAVSIWFRYHIEALDDPKVQLLSGDDFKTWVNLLCIAAKNNGKLPAIEDISFSLRRPSDAIEAVLERFLSATLIDKVSGGVNGYHYAPHGWKERQYKSDTSTERVKRFRATVTETAPEPDTEPDTEPEEESNDKTRACAIPNDWEPKQFGEGTQSRKIVDSWDEETLATNVEHFIAHHRKLESKFKDWQSAWSTWVLNSKKFGGNKFNGKRTNNDEPKSPLLRAVLDEEARRAAEPGLGRVEH